MDSTAAGAVKGTTSFEMSSEAPAYDHLSSVLDPRNEYDVESNVVKEIQEFFAKPVAVGSGTFATTNTWGDNLFTGDIYTLFKAQAIWLNKIQGFLSIRGDVKIRVVINSTPFQAGLLRLSYFPCSDTLGSEALMHRYSRQTISQLPGAYLNIQDNAVEVTIPYVAPPTYLMRDLVSPTVPSWGSIYLDVFEVLRTGSGPTSVNFTIWMSMENVELSGQLYPQCAHDECPQRGRSYRKRQRQVPPTPPPTPESSPEDFLRSYRAKGNLWQWFRQSVRPQMADSELPRRRRTRKAPTPIDQESNGGKGPLTRILDSGARLAKDAASFPMLTALAQPTSWALAAASAAANTLGWSKPTVTADAGRFMKGNLLNGQNFDGGDMSVPLSLVADNKISTITDAAPDDIDEMSFKYINQVWAYHYDFQWSTSAVAGTQLTAAALGPKTFWNNSTLGGKTVSTIPPCALGSTICGLYRGGFELKVTVVKTGFHTGTLAISYAPGKQAVTPISYANTNYLYRAIVDIQEGNEFTFKFPYILAQSFTNVSDNIGAFSIHVVNPLLAPATVASTCDVFLQIRGADDLQYAAPGDWAYAPVVPQGIHNEDVEPITKELGVKGVDPEPVHHCQQSIGEYCSSILMLMKSHWTLQSSNAVTYPKNSRSITIQAHRFAGERYNGVTWGLAEFGGDPISFFASCYVFSRGAMRYKFAYSAQGAASNTYMLKALTTAGGTTSYYSNVASSVTNSMSNGGAAFSERIAVVPADNGGLAVQVPFYSRYRYMLNQFIVAPGTGALEYMPNNALAIDQSGNDTIWMRSLGDDFQFSYFVGVPVFTVTSYNR